MQEEQEEQDPWNWGWEGSGEGSGSRGGAQGGPLACPAGLIPSELSFILLVPSACLGGREGWDPLQAVPNVFPWLRLRFRCSCAAPEAVQGWAGAVLVQGDPGQLGSPLGGDGKLWGRCCIQRQWGCP